MKPKHKRLITILTLVCLFFTGVFIILSTFRDNLVYYYPPQDLYKIQTEEPDRFKKLSERKIRVGGLIKPDSYENIGGKRHIFSVVDDSKYVVISHKGLLPPMFRENQGVVAEGFLSFENGILILEASKLITKHDENYMPPEIETRN
jgi:cytochrome c-type biogenesis protein CcmE